MLKALILRGVSTFLHFYVIFFCFCPSWDSQASTSAAYSRTERLNVLLIMEQWTGYKIQRPDIASDVVPWKDCGSTRLRTRSSKYTECPNIVFCMTFCNVIVLLLEYNIQVLFLPLPLIFLIRAKGQSSQFQSFVKQSLNQLSTHLTLMLLTSLSYLISSIFPQYSKRQFT